MARYLTLRLYFHSPAARSNTGACSWDISPYHTLTRVIRYIYTQVKPQWLDVMPSAALAVLSFSSRGQSIWSASDKNWSWAYSLGDPCWLGSKFIVQITWGRVKKSIPQGSKQLRNILYTWFNDSWHLGDWKKPLTLGLLAVQARGRGGRTGLTDLTKLMPDQYLASKLTHCSDCLHASAMDFTVAESYKYIFTAPFTELAGPKGVGLIKGVWSSNECGVAKNYLCTSRFLFAWLNQGCFPCTQKSNERQ